MADDTATTADNGQQQQSGQTQDAGTQAKNDTIVSGQQAAAGDQTQQQQQGQQQTQQSASWYTEEWRDKLAESLQPGDKAFRERLNRFTDPTGPVKSWLELEKQKSAGVLRKTLSENASPEELAAYRKEIGLPEKPEEYPLEPPKDVTITDADKPVLDAFKKFAHEHAVEPKVAQGIANWFLANRENELQDLHEKADQAVQDRIVELRTEWPGQEYTKNVTLGNNFIAEVMGDKGPDLAGIVLADGTKLGSHPSFVRFAAQAARNFSSSDLGLGDPAGGVNVDSRINDIKKLMADQHSEYWKGPKSAELQTEYRNLIERRDRQKSRAA